MLGEKLAEVRRGKYEPVIDPSGPPPTEGKAGLPQNRQMSGHRGLRQFESFLQVTDAHLWLRYEEIQKPDAYRVGNGLEQAHGAVQVVGSGS